MSVTVENLKAIAPGTSQTFTATHPKELKSAKALAYEYARINPEWGVKFSCKVDMKKLEVTISAIPAVETQKA